MCPAGQNINVGRNMGRKTKRPKMGVIGGGQSYSRRKALPEKALKFYKLKSTPKSTPILLMPFS
jgi:hypothetical protein